MAVFAGFAEVFVRSKPRNAAVMAASNVCGDNRNVCRNISGPGNVHSRNDFIELSKSRSFRTFIGVR
jgi:hypothetical protein